MILPTNLWLSSADMTFVCDGCRLLFCSLKKRTDDAEFIWKKYQRIKTCYTIQFCHCSINLVIGHLDTFAKLLESENECVVTDRQTRFHQQNPIKLLIAPIFFVWRTTLTLCQKKECAPIFAPNFSKECTPTHRSLRNLDFDLFSKGCKNFI